MNTNTVLAATGHKEVTIPGKEPSYTEAGYTESTEPNGGGQRVSSIPVGTTGKKTLLCII